MVYMMFQKCFKIHEIFPIEAEIWYSFDIKIWQVREK